MMYPSIFSILKYLREASGRVFHWYENCPDIAQDNRIVRYKEKPVRIGNRFLIPCPVCSSLDEANK